jgi:hypothetical protein
VCGFPAIPAPKRHLGIIRKEYMSRGISVTGPGLPILAEVGINGFQFAKYVFLNLARKAK